MCRLNNHMILSESDRSQITWCSCCQTYSLVFNSCCASFTEVEFKQYKWILDSLTPSDFHYDMVGRDCAVIKNPNSCIGFCLTHEERDELTDLIGQAMVMSEAYQIVKD